MAGKDIAATGFALTADAGTDGSVTVASTTTLRVGQKGFISSTTEASAEIIVTEITSGTVFKAKLARTLAALGDQSNYKLQGHNYGTSDLSIYDLADTARVDFPRQLVYNEPV